MKHLFTAISALVLLVTGCSREPEKDSHDKMWAESRGYQISWAAGYRHLTVTPPNSPVQQWDMSALRRVSLQRVNARESPTRRHQYRWVLEFADGTEKQLPYLALEPFQVLHILAHVARVNTGFTARGAELFYQDQFTVCTVWAAQGVEKVPVGKGHKECPLGGLPVWSK